MNIYIITGTSKGLGEAIANRLLAKENHLFCLSRGLNESLIKKASEDNYPLNYLTIDLNNTDSLEGLMKEIFEDIKLIENIESITLINNAGQVAPINRVENCLAEEIMGNIRVNLGALMILSASFVRYAKEIRVKKQIINISSGAGKRAIYGWGPYCSTKAGVNMLTECMGIEQESEENPVRVIAFGPGIIDTDLQVQIRATDKENFKDVEQFRSFKEEGKLRTADFVASKVIEVINDNTLENGLITDISEFI